MHKRTRAATERESKGGTAREGDRRAKIKARDAQASTTQWSGDERMVECVTMALRYARACIHGEDPGGFQAMPM